MFRFLRVEGVRIRPKPDTALDIGKPSSKACRKRMLLCKNS